MAMTALRRIVALLLLAASLHGAGCRSAATPDGDVPPVPPAPSATSNSMRGGLLQTGAVNLGPGVGQNWYRWQGDGEWGF
jgi:hypothetical protein